MNRLEVNKAKQTLTKKISSRLDQSLRSSGLVTPSKPGASRAFGMASQDILEDLLTDPEALVALWCLFKDNSENPSAQSEWLKTEEAATLMGFSRPYVAALIDAGEFGADAAKTSGGHRRVRASAVEKWLKDHAVTPSRKSQVESTDDAEFFEVPELTSTSRESLIAEIQSMRSQSLHHRPPRRRST